MSNIKVVLAPGDGGGDLNRSRIWYSWMREELRKSGITCNLRNFPDPFQFRAKYWLPFMQNELSCDQDTVVVAHSAGTVAAMRLAELQRLKGIVLVAAWYTPGDQSKEPFDGAGYCDTPWNWYLIKKNCEFILQFHSVDDDTCMISEARDIHKFLGSEYYEYNNRGHFQQGKFPELVEIVKKKLKGE